MPGSRRSAHRALTDIAFLPARYLTACGGTDDTPVATRSQLVQVTENTIAPAAGPTPQSTSTPTSAPTSTPTDIPAATATRELGLNWIKTTGQWNTI
jgi:hypothetical protein